MNHHPEYFVYLAIYALVGLISVIKLEKWIDPNMTSNQETLLIGSLVFGWMIWPVYIISSLYNLKKHGRLK